MTRRVALCGFSIECNRFGAVADAKDFAAEYLLRGAALVDALAADPPRVGPEMRGFAAEMNAREPWTPVPLILAASHPKGPVDAALFDGIVNELRERLVAAGPLDGVYALMHGAGLTTEDDDPDGTFLATIRDVVGPSVPVVATFDLHANVSLRMVASVDGFVGFRTNPHVDMVERGAEAAGLLRAIWTGHRPAIAFLRLPIVPPTLTMSTMAGTGPFADLMARASRLLADGVVGVSVMGSFPHSDTADNGIAILVTTDGDPERSSALALDLADGAWRDRHGYVIRLTSVMEAARRARAASDNPTAPRVILADLGDNPGGGAPGTSTGLLRALLDAGARDVVAGILHDPALVDAAMRAGVGADVPITLQPFEGVARRRRARVARLAEGRGIGRRGILAGSKLELGPSAVLAIDGITLLVSSHRQSPNDPAYFETCGIDLSAARAIVLKSRGHFRAGFDEFAAQRDMLEVDTPGITSPNLANFTWRSLPRPSFPLDPDARFSPVVHLFGRGAR